MNKRYTLEGKVALVTGAARGIGLGVAQEFIKMGAVVAITDLNGEALAEAKAQLGDACFTYINDVTVKEEHAALVAQIEQDAGPVDALINNAGRHFRKPSMECEDKDFAAVLDCNLHSIFSLTKAAFVGMMKRGRGSVINISSMSAIFGLPEVAAYSSSKTALLGLTRTLASEYSASGVRFNAIAPGFIESKMFRSIMDEDPARERRILDRTPLKRTGLPEEIGYAAVFLTSDTSEIITGICLPVDGGAAIGF